VPRSHWQHILVQVGEVVAGHGWVRRDLHQGPDRCAFSGRIRLGRADQLLEDLRSLSDEELVRQHDEHITGEFRPGVAVRVDYYLEELQRREILRQGQRMERLTWVILALTVVNVGAVLVALLT
jgi:hypothetical protein